MDFQTMLDHCLTKPGAWRDEPWEGDIVAKVDEKIFAFVGHDFLGIKGGVDREEADEWLARYPDDVAIMSYIGRHGWNTLRVGGSISDRELLEAIDDSYLHVVSKLPRSRRPDGWEQA